MAEWRTGPCRCFDSHPTGLQRRNAQGIWVQEAARIAWCTHERSPMTRQAAVQKAMAPLRCDGFLERCEVAPEVLPASGGPASEARAGTPPGSVGPPAADPGAGRVGRVAAPAAGASRRRRHERSRRRFGCELRHGSRQHRGIVIDLSASGLFVQTEAVLATGAEVEVQLAASGRVPKLPLRVLVVRRRTVPIALAREARSGIALEILEAPVEYGLAFGSAPLAASIRRAPRRVGGTSEGDPPAA